MVNDCQISLKIFFSIFSNTAEVSDTCNKSHKSFNKIISKQTNHHMISIAFKYTQYSVKMFKNLFPFSLTIRISYVAPKEFSCIYN